MTEKASPVSLEARAETSGELLRAPASGQGWDEGSLQALRGRAPRVQTGQMPQGRNPAHGAKQTTDNSTQAEE